MIINNDDTKIYIYNPIQAKYLINNRCTMIDIGRHTKTKKQYWVFIKDDKFDITMTDWLSRKNETIQQKI